MESKLLLQSDQIARIIERLAYEILEKHDDCDDLILIGIERRGVDLARRIQKVLAQRLGKNVPLGTLDINLYRDDWTSIETSPHVGQSRIVNDVNKKTIILIDDVLYTGRTIRSALEAIMDYGRPSCVKLLVLIDRGHRELPIHADFVGRAINTARKERIDVLLTERDGKDEVWLLKP